MYLMPFKKKKLHLLAFILDIVECLFINIPVKLDSFKHKNVFDHFKNDD